MGGAGDGAHGVDLTRAPLAGSAGYCVEAVRSSIAFCCSFVIDLEGSRQSHAAFNPSQSSEKFIAQPALAQSDDASSSILCTAPGLSSKTMMNARTSCPRRPVKYHASKLGGWSRDKTAWRSGKLGLLLAMLVLVVLIITPAGNGLRRVDRIARACRAC
jgi:hypothetical protein